MGGAEQDEKRKKFRSKNNPPTAEPLSASDSLDSGTGSFEESEGKTGISMAKDDASKPAECGNEKNNTFRFVYLGNSLLDRRYTQSMLPWVIAEVKRRKERLQIDLNVELMTVKALDESNCLIFEHRVQTITRCARSLDKKCFAYLTKSSADNCYCYVFEAHDGTSVSKD